MSQLPLWKRLPFPYACRVTRVTLSGAARTARVEGMG